MSIPPESAATPTAPEPSPRALTLPVVAVLTVAITFTLLGFRSALSLPGGQGVEDVLAWTRPEAVMAAVAHWQGGQSPAPTGWLSMRPHVEAAYVLVDTWLYMPLYATLLMLMTRALQDTLARDGGPQTLSPLGVWMQRRGLATTGLLVGSLLLVDAVENHGGALRFGIPVLLFGGCLVAGGVLGGAMWVAATHEGVGTRRTAWWVTVAAFASGALLAGHGTFGTLVPSACLNTSSASCAPLGALAHQVKPWLASAAAGLVVLGWLLWLFGADRRSDDRLREGAPNLRADRARLRSGLAAIIWRTRYVLLVLVLYAALTLGLDQCRDVLLALAHWPEGDEQGVPGLHRLGMILMVGLSVMLFVYSTWLWARLACRIRRQRDVSGGPAATPAATPARDERLQAQLGVFARHWARALSLVPLLCIYALVALSISDAINAAAARPEYLPPTDSLALTVATLCAIGFVAIGLGGIFLMTRRVLSLASDADYFNHEEGLYRLLQGRWEQSRPAMPVVTDSLWGRLRARLWRTVRRLHAATAWINPRTLPPMALALVLLIRFGLAWGPESMSAVPAALALVTLTLVWWMGVAGALTLAEVRLGRPYGLFLIALLGLVALLPFGVGDNHVLSLTAPHADSTVLDTLRMQGLGLVAVLTALIVGLWWLFTADLPSERWAQGWPGRRWIRPALLRPAVRSSSVVLAVALAMIALRVADRATPPVTAADPQTARQIPNAVPTLSQAVAHWVEQLSTVPPGPVYLVASEGGGIRSAYWTAQVLATLRLTIEDFDRRTFALSGVSGGAMGIAAYSACVRSRGPETPIPPSGTTPGVAQSCLKAAFTHLDPLSPLLAAWLFEDALARALPVPMASDGLTPGWRCRQPACGHLSRALGFEREWVRALPALAQPIATAGRAGNGWQPHMLLNGTWVESGELASVSSLMIEPDAFPAARDVQRHLGRELSLIGGAHVAARFPFINPLAAVQPAADASLTSRRQNAAIGNQTEPGQVDGHLADGGYFDNSATAALAPVWRQVQATLRTGEQPRDLVVLLIRNGQKPAACDRTDRDGPSPECIVPPQPALSRPCELSRPTRRRNWDLYADMLGPAVTVLNVSGIGAHGRHAPAMLQAEANTAATSRTPPVLAVDQWSSGALVPLGWYLSPTARESLEQQAGRLRDALRTSGTADRGSADPATQPCTPASRPRQPG